jgi:hypothetical protein
MEVQRQAYFILATIAESAASCIFQINGRKHKLRVNIIGSKDIKLRNTYIFHGRMLSLNEENPCVFIALSASQL